MSGIELALAIVPLMIAAAEHEKKIRETAEVVFSRREKANRQLDFYYELFDELSLLSSTLSRLASSIAPHLTTSGPQRLSESERDALNNVLGMRAISFQSILDRLLKSLEDIISDRSVDLEPSDILDVSPIPFFTKLEAFKVKVDRGIATNTLLDRFRFTRNEKSRQVAMIKIKDYNEKLERLLRGADGEYQMYRTVSRRPETRRLRRLSNNLFAKVANRWVTGCDCQNSHEARLCLWNCCSQQRHDRSMDSIDLMVSIPDVDEDGVSWQESLIFISTEAEEQHQHEGSVSFPGIDPLPNSFGREVKGNESLCSLLRNAHGRQMALQIIFDRDRLWQARARRRSLVINRQRDVTLRQLLADSQQRFTLKEQRILAVVLAHAALHCANGPWLSENWSKEHISFFRADADIRPDVRHPFLKIRFEEEVVSTDDNLFCMHPNPRLLALGIVLLEIYLKDTIESRWSESDLNNGVENENTNLTTALRLLEDFEDDLYEGYRNAIAACLDFDLAESDAEELTQKMYQAIVVPLEEELYHAFRITPEDLQLTF